MLLFLVGCMPVVKSNGKVDVPIGKEVVNNKQQNGQTVKQSRVVGDELLKNKKIRKVLSSALDKNQISSEILADGSSSIDYLISEHPLFDYIVSREEYPINWGKFDLLIVKKQWEQVKKELKFDQIKLSLLTADDELSLMVAENIKKQLEDNLSGLNIELNIQSFDQKINLLEKGNYDIVVVEQSIDYVDPLSILSIWQSDNIRNYSSFNSRQYDVLLKKYQTDVDINISERVKTLQEAEKLLLAEEVVALPLYRRSNSYLQNSAIRGIDFNNIMPLWNYKSIQTIIETDGKYLIRLLTEHDLVTLDNSKAVNVDVNSILSNVLEGLYGYDEALYLAGAESVERSDDKLQYTFHLRKDALWSNGETVKADDYVYAWQRLANPKKQFPNRHLLKLAAIKNATAVLNGELPLEQLGISAVDEYTLLIELERPIDYLEQILALPNFYPINKAFCEVQAENFGTGVQTMLYNGAYWMTDWQKTKNYSLTKSPTYYAKDEVLNDGVTFTVMKDLSGRIHQFEVGMADYVELNGEYVEQYRDYPAFHHSDRARIAYLLFNLK